ncbi:unnamed protein product [Enterobius vermicularis]|uniref:Battenin n=1 Tax=Enterobius vermicularis TaxID=51028 RepID=A0A0N4UYB2_ENTVE|nr:unnamed protein product [Enterobius vermicularis]
MLSGAEDIINQHDPQNSTTPSYCEDKLTSRHCTSISTGAILLADILPMLFVKLTLPLYMEKIPIEYGHFPNYLFLFNLQANFSIRHGIIVVCAAVALFIVAFASDITMALSGVVLASFSSGLGEVSYISFTSYFGRSAVSAWSSGTGGASIFGSLIYAGLTEPHFAHLSPKNALLLMLCIPAILTITYGLILVIPKSIYRIKIYDPRTWKVPQWYLKGEVEKEAKQDVEQDSFRKTSDCQLQNATLNDINNEESCILQRQLTTFERLYIVLPLLKYMIPLTTVYFAEYLINQGLVQLIIFDCSSGLNLGLTSQYRWYQVLYQSGVFISRSTSGFYNMPSWLLYLLPLFQMMNAVFFFFIAKYLFIPHIGILLALIFLEGIIGGSSYVNTFKHIYSKVSGYSDKLLVEPDTREFSLSAASLSDTFGVAVAGCLALPTHNYICKTPFPH